MQLDSAILRNLLSRDLTDVLIRVGLIAFVVVMSVRVFAPFAGLVLWALILAVAFYPLHQRLAKRFGGRQGRAATLLAVGYQMFMDWVDEAEEGTSAESGRPEAAVQASCAGE